MLLWIRSFFNDCRQSLARDGLFKSLCLPIALCLITAVSAHFLLDTMPYHYDLMVMIGSALLALARLSTHFKGWTHASLILNYVIFFYAGIFFLLILIHYVTKLMLLTDRYGFEYMLQENLEQAALLFFFISFLQPIILPVPETVTILAGTAVLGAPKAFVAAYLGTTLGIVFMYTLTKLGGDRLRANKHKHENLDRFYHYVDRYGIWALVALLIFPVLPDEIISVGAGLSAIPYKRFIPIVLVAKLVSSYVLAFLPHLFFQF